MLLLTIGILLLLWANAGWIGLPLVGIPAFWPAAAAVILNLILISRRLLRRQPLKVWLAALAINILALFSAGAWFMHYTNPQ